MVAFAKRSVLRHVLGGLAVALLAGLVHVPVSVAASPWWHLSSGTRPSYLPSASTSEGTVTPGRGEVVVTAENVGDADVVGVNSPTEITDKLPPGLKALAIAGDSPILSGFNTHESLECSLQSLSCRSAGSLHPYAQMEVRIAVEVLAGATSGEINLVSISGGGARSSSIRRPIVVSQEDTPFGVEDYELSNEEEGGDPATQAGSHPFQQTTTLALNQTADGSPPELGGPVRGNPVPFAGPVELVKNLRIKWPSGLIGNPQAVPRCTMAQFLTRASEAYEGNLCPAQTAVGVAAVSFEEPLYAGFVNTSVPLFDLEPAVGEPAKLGFVVQGYNPVIIDTSVRTGGDYGVTISINNITQTVAFVGSRVTVWGVPGDPRHDAQRGWGCLALAIGEGRHLPCESEEEQQHPQPFLTMPTSCTGQMQTSIEAESWDDKGNFQPPLTDAMLGLDGCNRLPFSPSVTTAPDVSDASTPTGLTVDVHVPQTAGLDPAGLAESSVKGIQVTLPVGVALNPAGADGLQACSEGQVGFTDVNGQSGASEFTPELPAASLRGADFCPDAAKIATATIKTPLLPDPLEGYVYLATQNENPFGSLVAMYLVAEDPVSGTLVKLPGEVSLNQATGQITATFENSPQLPFEDAELHFFGGERAPLATPAHCGTYTTVADFVPWSGQPSVGSTSSFQITEGPNGSACPGAALPFAPTLTGGTINNQAGAFSPFTMTMSREDGNQSLESIELHMPPGLSGVLSGIPLCGEAEADAGTCSTASLVGETTVSVGLGGNPYTVKGGQVFLTGPYKGAPFGLSIVNPAVAGPFNLGKVIVRAKLEVDPHTAAVTVTSDASGPYAIPPSIDGIPLQIKHVNVMIDRPGFTFNPTNCTPSAVTGNLQSIEGAASSLSVPFQATNCSVLKFAPKFAATTSGKTSKANGASLHVELTYPQGPEGTYANIARVKVDLPKALPSRLTTLQKACTAAQFEANPAGCPAASIIGHAKALTPLVPVPLEGPAYFVSHGGEAFPSLIMVLQGYGVTLDLVGSTFISKAGITSSTFKTVPDAPVGSFELSLPEGKYSALAANGDLCRTKLAMPTEFLAQNGAVIHESTPIAVAGCSSSISLVSHSLKGRNLKVAVSVPAAGKLTVTGKGLSSASKRASGQETIAVALTQKRAGKLETKVKLSFTSSKGAKQSKTLTVKFKK
jgi:hypothetical protein